MDAETRRRLEALLREIEMHCPCGARPESPIAHPHVGGCPVAAAIALLAALPAEPPDDGDGYVTWSCGCKGGGYAASHLSCPVHHNTVVVQTGGTDGR